MADGGSCDLGKKRVKILLLPAWVLRLAVGTALTRSMPGLVVMDTSVPAGCYLVQAQSAQVSWDGSCLEWQAHVRIRATLEDSEARQVAPRPALPSCQLPKVSSVVGTRPAAHQGCAPARHQHLCSRTAGDCTTQALGWAILKRTDSLLEANLEPRLSHLTGVTGTGLSNFQGPRPANDRTSGYW